MDNKNSIKILVVDDEKIVRDFLNQLLTSPAIEVKTVDNGPEAIEAVEKEDFDLVFLDVRMPGIDGLETYRQLKKIKPKPKYIMMTGYAVDDILEKAGQEGVAYSLKKPFNISEIKKITDDYVKAKASRDPMKILIVDDEEVVLNFFKKLLQEDIYNLTTVKTGEEALNCIKKEDFDLAFLDTVLDDMKGIDLYQRIQQIKPGLAIVMITGYIEKCVQLEQALPNIKGCLYKPFEINKIFDEINDIRRFKGL